MVYGRKLADKECLNCHKFFTKLKGSGYCKPCHRRIVRAKAAGMVEVARSYQASIRLVRDGRVISDTARGD